MTDREVPLHRLDEAPSATSIYPTLAERVATLRHSLRGVERGAWDDRIVTWVAGWDDATLRTLCSWIERARFAERSAVADRIEAEIATVRAEYEQVPPAVREPYGEQENYRAGLRYGADLLRGIDEYVVTDDAVDAAERARRYLGGGEVTP